MSTRLLALAIICWPPLCGAMQLIPEPIAPPIPEDEEYMRVWGAKKMAALDELIHADTLQGKYRLPEGYTLKDGAVWGDGVKFPKVWSTINAGVIAVPPDRKQFNRKSYMVPFDLYELYEKRLGD